MRKETSLLSLTLTFMLFILISCHTLDAGVPDIKIISQ
jgi:hypothetical protein